MSGADSAEQHCRKGDRLCNYRDIGAVLDLHIKEIAVGDDLRVSCQLFDTLDNFPGCIQTLKGLVSFLWGEGTGCNFSWKIGRILTKKGLQLFTATLSSVGGRNSLILGFID